jgi:hypothetical protein
MCVTIVLSRASETGLAASCPGASFVIILPSCKPRELTTRTLNGRRRRGIMDGYCNVRSLVTLSIGNTYTVRSPSGVTLVALIAATPLLVASATKDEMLS